MSASGVDVVRTTAGDFRPGVVVVAAGAWSSACVRRIGLRLLVQPVRGYSVTVKAAETGLTRPVLLAEARAAVTPLGEQLRFAGLLEVGSRLNLPRGVAARRIATLRRLVAGYLPALAGLPAVAAWSGLRPCTPDGLPYLGFASRYRNLFVAAGHGAIGMGLAPATGELAAQAIAGEQPGLDITAFRVGRFDREGERTR